MKIDINLSYRFGIKAGRICGSLDLNLLGGAVLGRLYRMIAMNAVKANTGKLRDMGLTGSIAINGQAIAI
jgi:hypothetical protein